MTTSENKQSKTWVIAGAALVVLIGVFTWVLSRPSMPADEPLAAESEPQALKLPPAEPSTASPALQPAEPAPAKPAAPPPPPPAEPVDLFAGEMPDFMADLHARVLGKRLLNVEQQKALYKWGQEHKDDARPQLILAWDSRNRDWDGMAISVYGMAFRADPRAAQDPKNLRDLLDLASQHEPGRVEFDDASKIVKDHFGLNALPVLEEEVEKLTEAGNLVRATRLSKLRDELRGR